MIKRITKWFTKPYYLNQNNRFNFKMSIGVGVAVFAFLVIFQPLGVSVLGMKINPYLFRLAYGVITTLVMLIYFFVLIKTFPRYYNKETWTTGKHLINILGIVLFCGIINVLFTKLVLKPKYFEENINVVDILTRSILYGLILSLAYIYYDEKQRLSRAKIITERVMKNTSIKKSNRISLNKEITIHSTNKKDAISFCVNDLVYITSESNYACLFIKERNKDVKERILRLPLKNVQLKLEEFTNIIRCHKSFIVNTNYVKSISGNARRYYLHIEKLETKIPVSRRFNHKDLENLISS